MVRKKNIENAVIKHFKVSIVDLYSHKNEYPINGARSVLMYLLYANKLYTFPELQKIFKYNSQRTVEMRIAKISQSVRINYGKYNDDVNAINDLLTK